MMMMMMMMMLMMMMNYNAKHSMCMCILRLHCCDLTGQESREWAIWCRQTAVAEDVWRRVPPKNYRFKAEVKVKLRPRVHVKNGLF